MLTLPPPKPDDAYLPALYGELFTTRYSIYRASFVSRSRVTLHDVRNPRHQFEQYGPRHEWCPTIRPLWRNR